MSETRTDLYAIIELIFNAHSPYGTYSLLHLNFENKSYAVIIV